MNENNIILMTDSYKLSHAEQYPNNTTLVYSYGESRGGRFSKTMMYGLQIYLKKYLIGQQVTKEKIDEAEPIVAMHLNNAIDMKQWRIRWEYILDVHEGRLPIEIKAVPEGTILPIRNVLFTIQNTDKKCFWLTNYIETLISKIWYPITVATQSFEIKNNIKKYLKLTGCENIENEIMFKCHDFGYRGSTSEESAGIGGSANLVNFYGTDTIAAIMTIRKFYDSDMAGFSIPASEHSTITSWGKENENLAMKNMLQQYPTGMIACVSDSFDIYNACWEIWGTELREQIMGRDGVLVVRPDSGNPADVVLKIINILGDRFGYSTNKLGFKVLDPHIRIIQGDGVNYNSINEILETLYLNKWAAENVAFGSGGALLQKMDRDTIKFAVKCSFVVVDNEERDVYKNPITDPGKISKKGRLKLVFENNEYVTKNIDESGADILETVFLNGKLMKEYSFEEIRLRANNVNE